MIPKSIAVGVGKGGVGKTSIATNLAALWARTYHEHVLFVDCDCQASATNALGVVEEVNDFGYSFLQAVVHPDRPPLDPVSNRTNLQVVTGGVWTQTLSREIATVFQTDRATAIEIVSRPFRDFSYDVAIFDLPPTGQNPLADTILASVSSLLVPTGVQSGDLTGVPVLAQQLRDDEISVPVLGVVLNAVPKRQTRALANAVKVLDESLDRDVHIFDRVIPEAKAAFNIACDEHILIDGLADWASKITIDERKQLSRDGKIGPPANTAELYMALAALTHEVRQRFHAVLNGHSGS